MDWGQKKLSTAVDHLVPDKSGIILGSLGLNSLLTFDRLSSNNRADMAYKQVFCFPSNNDNGKRLNVADSHSSGERE